MRSLLALLPCLCLTLLCGVGAAQYNEVGLATGAAAYSGELSNQGFVGAGYQPSVGIFARRNLTPRFAAKAMLMLGTLRGADATSNNAAQHPRNLDFRSPLYELSAMGEFNVMPYAARNHQSAAVYLTAGVAAFHFNPRTEFNGELVALQPLGTEGQGSASHPDRDRYARLGAAAPFGAGLKVNLTDRFNLGAEVLFRVTSTDYLDDVGGDYPDVRALYDEDPLAAALSFRTPEFAREALANPVGQARGDASQRDMYLSIQVHASFNLTSKYGLDFDPKYDIFKTAPPALHALLDWPDVPQA